MASGIRFLPIGAELSHCVLDVAGASTFPETTRIRLEESRARGHHMSAKRTWERCCTYKRLSATSHSRPALFVHHAIAEAGTSHRNRKK